VGNGHACVIKYDIGNHYRMDDNDNDLDSDMDDNDQWK